jgi:hypothetical protein
MGIKPIEEEEVFSLRALFTGAPGQRTRSIERYSIVQNAKGASDLVGSNMPKKP